MRKLIKSNSPFEKIAGFSRAVRAGDWISVAGTAPLSQQGETVGKGNLYLQTKRCLEISVAAIEAAGGTIQDVIRTRVMLADASRWQEAAKAHGEFFRDIRPACTFVEVSCFVDPDWLVETEVDCKLSEA